VYAIERVARFLRGHQDTILLQVIGHPSRVLGNPFRYLCAIDARGSSHAIGDRVENEEVSLQV